MCKEVRQDKMKKMKKKKIRRDGDERSRFKMKNLSTASQELLTLESSL